LEVEEVRNAIKTLGKGEKIPTKKAENSRESPKKCSTWTYQSILLQGKGGGEAQGTLILNIGYVREGKVP